MQEIDVLSVFDDETGEVIAQFSYVGDELMIETSREDYNPWLNKGEQTALVNFIVQHQENVRGADVFTSYFDE